jgi:hypothetical protein
MIAHNTTWRAILASHRFPGVTLIRVSYWNYIASF